MECQPSDLLEWIILKALREKCIMKCNLQTLRTVRKVIPEGNLRCNVVESLDLWVLSPIAALLIATPPSLILSSKRSGQEEALKLKGSLHQYSSQGCLISVLLAICFVLESKTGCSTFSFCCLGHFAQWLIFHKEKAPMH